MGKRKCVSKKTSKSSKPKKTKSKKTSKEAPKKRGRPKGSKNKPKAAEAVEEALKIFDDLENAPKRKRGRPKGSKNKPKVEAPKKRGRPKGSKNKPKVAEEAPKRGRGRPKGSKNKAKRDYVKQIEADILDDLHIEESESENDDRPAEDIFDHILFKIPHVPDPLVGTPKEVQKELDGLALKMQKSPGSKKNDAIFNKIHLYMHGYLINVVLKKFPFIRGSQTVDVYQETLIALRFKAIPGFRKNRGMSFLNFAKMCIRRHLITKLHASKHRNKDKTINQAVSLDSSPVQDEDGDERNSLANVIGDDKDTQDVVMEKNEAYEVTKDSLLDALSEFERIVLNEYLTNKSYQEIAKDISKTLKRRYNTKSVDNALLRIRTKAMHLLKYAKKEDIPIFLQ